VPDTGRQALSGRESVAGRLDRLPVSPIHYLLAGVAQMSWGVVIGADLIISRLYPFIWEPKGLISPLEYDFLVVANTGVGLLLGEYLLGGLGDRIGRKRVLIIGGAIQGAFIWQIALTNSFGWLLLWNFLYAIGMGAVISQSQAYMHEILPPHSRSKVGLRGQVMAIGVSGLIASIPAYFWVPAHYQWVLYFLAAAPFVILIPSVLALPESPRWLEGKGREAEADKIVRRWEARIERRHGPLPPVEADYTVVVDKRVPLRELYRGEYGRRTIVLVICWIAAYGAMIYGFGFEAPVFLVVRNHFTPHELFGYTLAGSGATVVVLVLSSFLGERVDRKYLIAAGAVLFTVSVALLYTGTGITSGALFYVLSVTGESFFFLNLYSYTANSYPTRIRAAGVGATDGLGHVGSVLSPLVAGPLFTATAASSYYGWAIFVVVIGGLIPLAVILRFGHRQKGMALEELSR
jgi:MFS family permease